MWGPHPPPSDEEKEKPHPPPSPKERELQASRKRGPHPLSFPEEREKPHPPITRERDSLVLINQQSSQPTLLSRRPEEGNFGVHRKIIVIHKKVLYPAMLLAPSLLGEGGGRGPS
jgi:hypothetical protein